MAEDYFLLNDWRGLGIIMDGTFGMKTLATDHSTLNFAH